MKNYIFLVGVACIVIVLIVPGCGGPAKPMYAGERRPVCEIAIIEPDGAGTFIEEVDGKDIGLAHRAEILPGEHVLKLRHQTRLYLGLDIGTVPGPMKYGAVTFTAKPGHKYQVCRQQIRGFYVDDVTE